MLSGAQTSEAQAGPRPRPLRRTCTIAIRSVLLLIGAWLASALVSTTVGAECVKAVMVGDEPEEPTTISVASVTVSDDDLWITMDGPIDSAALIHLVDAAGIVNSTGAIVFDDGPQEVQLAGALGNLPGSGFQYRLLVSDPAGVLPDVELPLRFGLDCPFSGPCRWTAAFGIEADVPVADRELMLEMDRLRALGEEDPLAVLLHERPDLRGSIAELSWQLGDAEADLGKSGTACHCRWVGVEGYSQPLSQGTIQAAPPSQIHQGWVRWSGFWAAQLTQGTLTSAIGPRDIYAGMQLVCGIAPGGEFQIVEFKGKPPIQIPLPRVGSCQAPCTGEIEHTVSDGLCAEVKGFGTPSAPSQAALFLRSVLQVDSQTLFDVPLTLSLQAGSPQGTYLDNTAFAAASAQVLANQSESWLRLTGSAQLDIWAPSSDRPYWFAAATSRPIVDVQAYAACADTPQARFRLGGGGSDGGTIIERWGDPP